MKRRGLFWILLLAVLVLAFIWGNSLLPAEISGALSAGVKRFLAKLFPGLYLGGGDHRLRKWAHFLEFWGLGMVLCGLMWLLGGLSRRKILLSWLGGVLVACADEAIQGFVPGRGPGLCDVGIDVLGVTLGIVIISLIYLIKQKRKQSGGK